MHTLCVRVCVALVGASAFWRSSSSFACFARCSSSFCSSSSLLAASIAVRLSLSEIWLSSHDSCEIRSAVDLSIRSAGETNIR